MGGEGKQGDKEKAYNLCQVLVCMSIICTLFPFAFSSHQDIPEPSGSHVLKIDFSIAMAICPSCSKLWLAQLLASELVDGLLPPYFPFNTLLTIIISVFLKSADPSVGTSSSSTLH